MGCEGFYFQNALPSSANKISNWQQLLLNEDKHIDSQYENSVGNCIYAPGNKHHNSSIKMINTISILNSAKSNNAQTITSITSAQKEKDFQTIMTENLSENKPLVFLREDDERDLYTKEEMLSLSERDFHTRLFISSAVYRNNCVWIRNHHSVASPSGVGASCARTMLLHSI